jgi:hypothetical protein
MFKPELIPVSADSSSGKLKAAEEKFNQLILSHADDNDAVQDIIATLKDGEGGNYEKAFIAFSSYVESLEDSDEKYKLQAELEDLEDFFSVEE